MADLSSDLRERIVLAACDVPDNRALLRSLLRTDRSTRSHLLAHAPTVTWTARGLPARQALTGGSPEGQVRAAQQVVRDLKQIAKRDPATDATHVDLGGTCIWKPTCRIYIMRALLEPGVCANVTALTLDARLVTDAAYSGTRVWMPRLQSLKVDTPENWRDFPAKLPWVHARCLPALTKFEVVGAEVEPELPWSSLPPLTTLCVPVLASVSLAALVAAVPTLRVVQTMCDRMQLEAGAWNVSRAVVLISMLSYTACIDLAELAGYPAFRALPPKVVIDAFTDSIEAPPPGVYLDFLGCSADVFEDDTLRVQSIALVIDGGGVYQGYAYSDRSDLYMDVKTWMNVDDVTVSAYERVLRALAAVWSGEVVLMPDPDGNVHVPAYVAPMFSGTLGRTTAHVRLLTETCEVDDNHMQMTADQVVHGVAQVASMLPLHIQAIELELEDCRSDRLSSDVSEEAAAALAVPWRLDPGTWRQVHMDMSSSSYKCMLRRL